MSRVIKLDRVYQNNEEKLKRWAKQGLPYAALISEQGLDDVTPLFRTFESAAQYAHDMKWQGRNVAIVETYESRHGTSHRFTVSVKVARTLC